jgi:hypothetical protein
LQSFEQANKSSIEDAATQKTRIEQLEEELAKMTSEKELLQTSFQRKIDVRL